MRQPAKCQKSISRNRLPRMRALLLALLALLAVHSAALAEERIEQFTSDSRVNVDGSVDVLETISVNAESQQIRRGIFRDFPTIYTDRNGLRVVVGVEVISVKRDRQTEPYAIEGLATGKRIRIGTADVFLDPG